MSRYKAAGLHFLGSASVLLLIFALVRWIWYPGPLFMVANGINLIGIIAGVDVVLGPLIMLIIFNPQKKLIKLDVAIVLLLQLGFLGYGTWSLLEARPAVIAFVENRFYMVTANEIEPAELKKATDPAFKSLSFTGPMLVGTQPPSDRKKAEDIELSSFGGMGIQNLPQYYVPYSQVLEKIKIAQRPVGAMNRISKEDRAFLEQYELKNKPQKYGFIPLIGKRRVMFAVVDSATGNLLEMIKSN